MVTRENRCRIRFGTSPLTLTLSALKGREETSGLFRIAAALLLALATPALAAPTPKPAEPAAPAQITGALLQGLDKTTARVTKFVAPLGQMVRFGTLQVTVRDCRRRPPEETPESAAYLDIDEIKPGATTTDHLFSGWMFASSPAVSALEHPVYDVWVLACSTTPTGSTSKSG